MNPRKGKFAAGVRPARNFSSHRLSLISIHVPAASLSPVPPVTVCAIEFYQSQSSANIMQTSAIEQASSIIIFALGFPSSRIQLCIYTEYIESASARVRNRIQVCVRVRVCVCNTADNTSDIGY